MNIKNITKKEFKNLIADADDSNTNQIRINENGDIIMYSAIPGTYKPDTKNYRLRSDAMHAGNGYAGVKASESDEYINTLYDNMIEAWKNGDDLFGLD